MDVTPTMELADLAVDGRNAPLGTATNAVRFTWRVHWTGAAIDSSPVGPRAQSWWSIRILRDERPVWDSGRVHSPEPWAMSPEGLTFAAWHEHVWELRVGVGDELLSAHDVFVPAPLAEHDWLGAQWIGSPDAPAPTGSPRQNCGDGSFAAPMMERRVRTQVPVRRALLALAAGGFADVLVDGRLATDEVLSPGTTHWDRRVQVVVHDLTESFTDRSASVAPPGGAEHMLALELGRGFFGITNASAWHWEKAPWHDAPRVRAILRLEHVDGSVSTVITDDRWARRPGARLLDDLYGGEIVDLRRRPGGELEPTAAPATLVAGPAGRLVARAEQPERIVEHLEPVRITRIATGQWVLSFPRVVAGWIRLAVLPGPAGTRLVIRYGERLRQDGLPNADDEKGYFADGFQTDEVVLDGLTTTWEPRFSYKGFRHVSISGWPDADEPKIDDVTACVVHTDAERISTFGVDDPLLQWIHDATLNTIENNLHGYPTDTPKYEKNGWTGDAAVGADMFLTNVDAGLVLGSFVDSLAETIRPGHPPDLVAPNAGVFGVDTHAPVWHSALVTIPWDVYLHTGDRRLMERHAEVIEQYARFELDRSPGGIADTILGDWVAPGTDPGGGNPPEDSRVPATAFLVRILDTVARINTVVGRDPKWAHEAAARVRSAFCAAFVDQEGADAVVAGPADEGFRQSHHVLALAFDVILDPIIRARTADALAADVHRRGGHLDTGAIGTKWLLPVLTDHGHADAAMAVALQTSVPSWGAWWEAGATSMFEHWDLEARSHGHYFLGTVDDWLTGWVAGLRPLTPGWSTFSVAPALTAWVQGAAFSVRTPYGWAAIRWSCRDEHVIVDVTVPFGTTAHLALPGEEPRVIGPGEHRFRSQRPTRPEEETSLPLS